MDDFSDEKSGDALEDARGLRSMLWRTIRKNSPANKKSIGFSIFEFKIPLDSLRDYREHHINITGGECATVLSRDESQRFLMHTIYLLYNPIRLLILTVDTVIDILL